MYCKYNIKRNPDANNQYDPTTNQVNQFTQGQECPCESPSCPPCILSKTERKLHERAMKDAKAD